MTKFNYVEPEFKVVKASTEDVITTSLKTVDDAWVAGDPSKGSGERVNLDDLFYI